jgi:hypothetical protein
MIKLTFEHIERELRRHNFGILSTVSPRGRSQSAGILYGVSTRDTPLNLYVITQSKTAKVRNILKNSNVSFVVPVARRLFSFVPPSCIYFQGTGRILEIDNQNALEAFRSSYILRENVKLASHIKENELGRVCFIRITSDPVILTYGLGISIMEFRKHAADAASRVEIPPQRRDQSDTLKAKEYSKD